MTLSSGSMPTDPSPFLAAVTSLLETSKVEDMSSQDISSLIEVFCHVVDAENSMVRVTNMYILGSLER